MSDIQVPAADLAAALPSESHAYQIDSALADAARSAVAAAARRSVETFLASQWSVIAGAADVAARTYRIGTDSADVAQEVAAHIGESILSGGQVPTGPQIGRIAARTAHRMADRMARAPLGRSADAGDSARAADDGSKQRAAVKGRRARIGVPRRHDVWYVAEDSRRTMRPVSDVSAVVAKEERLRAAMLRTWSPTRPAEVAAWDAMKESARTASPECADIMVGNAEAKDSSPAGRGPVVALRPMRPVFVSEHIPAVGTRAERLAARMAARRTESEASYLAFVAAGSGTEEHSLAAEDAKRAAESAVDTVKSLDAAARNRTVRRTVYRATECAVPAADQPADILLSAYVPEKTYAIRGAETDQPIMVKRGAVVAFSPTGPFTQWAMRNRPPIGALQTGGQRRVSAAAILPTDQYGRAAQAALGRAAKQWAADVLAEVRAAEDAEVNAMVWAAESRQSAEREARCGPSTYWWIKRQSSPIYTGPRTVGAGYQERADAEYGAMQRELDRYAAYWQVPTRCNRRAAVLARWDASRKVRAAREEAKRLARISAKSPAARLAVAAQDEKCNPSPMAYMVAYREVYQEAKQALAVLTAWRFAIMA